jgi:hypothetical protein
MKSKICILLLLIVLFSGCAVSKSDFSAYINEIVKESIARVNANYQNNHKKLYSYYLPATAGKYESNSISTILEINGYEVIMNLNVENVFAERYYENVDVSVNELLDSDLIYSSKGIYADYSGKLMNYALYINELNNGTSFILLRTSHFTYLTNVEFNDVGATLKEIFVIVKTTRINETEIVNYYSRKEVLNYDNKIVEIFQAKVPTNGDLSTLIQESEKEFDWTIDEMDYLDNGSGKSTEDESTGDQE